MVYGLKLAERLPVEFNVKMAKTIHVNRFENQKIGNFGHRFKRRWTMKTTCK